MPLIYETPDDLPYIDTKSSEESLAAAQRLILEELQQDTTVNLHHNIPALKASSLPPTIQAEFDRIRSGQAREGGIDLSRYDVLDAPAKGDLHGWRATLQKAYASSEYLRGRELNLALLETYGKNAWLISNSQLEDILRDIETEVEAAKTEMEVVENDRRATQANAAGEMQNLNDTWRQGIGRMIEAQAAAERLRQDILERRRHGAT